MGSIKGKRKKKGGKARKIRFRRKREEHWPRKFIPEHTRGKCPYCKKPFKNIEAHAKAKHRFEKPREVKGEKRGHE